MAKDRFEGDTGRRTVFIVWPSKSFPARYTGRCHRCHERILRGEPCQYLMGDVVHRDCTEPDPEPDGVLAS